MSFINIWLSLLCIVSAVVIGVGGISVSLAATATEENPLWLLGILPSTAWAALMISVLMELR
jgi:hypothetical protein